MAAPRSPWTAAMLHHLDSGEWCDFEQVLAVGMVAVPPGRALQQRERRRKYSTVAGQGPSRPTTIDDQIRYGARDLCRNALYLLAVRGAVVFDADRVRRSA